MQVTVNGRALELPDGCTVATLLERVQVDATRVAVERNQDVVPRKTYGACHLKDGDQVEIVTFVGGG
jgi:thiamine biosynthesis protein ThiS